MRSCLLAKLTRILPCALFATGSVLAADSLPHATDLAADGALAAARNIPIVVLYSSPGCHYCELVREQYLLPLQRDPAYAGRAILREVHLDAASLVTGFDGKPVREDALARAAGVTLYPTVVFYSPRGEQVASPLVGLLIADYYYGYLIDAIDTATRAIGAPVSPSPETTP
jgi:thioredoxin-related protein